MCEVKTMIINVTMNIASIIGCCRLLQVQKYATTVLSAMMAGMDDKEDMQDEITLEAMGGLSKILDSVDETQIRAILINISLRIRPCFEKVNYFINLLLVLF